jgi:hypothetical protein
MKKFFTLIALTLLSSGAFAQGKWNNLVVNGNMEGEQDPMWSSFWCHDWRQGVEFAEGSGQQYDDRGQFQGFAEIVEDPDDPTNHCARVIIRSKEEGTAAGNPTTDDANNKPDWAEWDSQFFIYANDTIPEGMELRMILKVKGEKESVAQTQAHYTPGDYNFYQLFGDISYGTTWKEIEVTTKVTSSHTQSASGKRFQSVAFNLSTYPEGMGNIIYIDDVRLEWRTPKEPEPFKEFFNLLRHGTLSNDKINNYTNFTGRDGKIGSDLPARVVDDPVDGQPALTVAGVCWEGEKQDVDNDGNPAFDEEGNPKMVQYFVKEDGTEKTEITDWESQFFVTVPHVFIPGSKYRLVMSYRADVDADVDLQLHKMPGGYVHYQAFNTIGSTLHFTPEWQTLELEEEMRAEGDGCQTIAFNTNKLKDQQNNYYFRFEEFAFNSGDLTDNELTLATEDVMLPVPEPANADGATGTIDFANCLSTLETETFEVLIDNMQVRSGDDSYDQVDASAGFYVADNGWLSQSETPISFEIGDVSDDNPVLEVITYNTGDSFAGKSITTKFRYEWKKWLYLFNVNLVPEETYTGISEVKTPAKSNVMYDLMGRRIQNATKGLYIMNGKKYFAK